ncbi:MAG: hypothetical protein ACE3L7_28040 [Candidatus Pristimantibacillus sp.]
MSIENKLTEAYKQKTTAMIRPKELDARIIQQYDEHIRSRERGAVTMRTKKPFIMKLVFATVVAAVIITGFSSSIWFKASDERVTIEQHSQEVEPIDAVLQEKLRGQMEQIKSELQVGESAILYSSELEQLDSIYKERPILPVTNPVIQTNYEQWRSLLEERVPQLKLPDLLAAGLTFNSGKEEGIMGKGISIENFSLIEELQAESKANGKSMVWRKVEDIDHGHFQAFTTLYTNDNQDQIYIMMELFNDKTFIRGSMKNASFEEVSLDNGMTGHYLEATPQQDLIYGLDHARSLMWLDTQEDMTIVYTIGSGETNVSKEELITVANSLE